MLAATGHTLVYQNANTAIKILVAHTHIMDKVQDQFADFVKYVERNATPMARVPHMGHSRLLVDDYMAF
jgi:hypothetical protein